MSIEGKLLDTDLEKTLKQAEESERLARETKPYPRTAKDRKQRMFELFLRIKDREEKSQKNRLEIMQTFVTANKHSSKVSNLADLKPIALNEMMVNKIHYGRYLLCRVCIKFYSSSAIATLVEDENGDVEDLSIYYYRRTFDEDPNEKLPVGTVLMIKEPFLKIAISSQGFFIRVDSPSDIVIVHEPALRAKFSGAIDPAETFERLKEEGNKYFAAKNYNSALRCYQEALFKRKCRIILLNCAAAYLALDCHWQAYKMAEMSLSVKGDGEKEEEEASRLNSEKARFRMGKAAYAMRQWRMAAENFEHCLSLNKENKAAKAELERTKARLAESTNGTFDLKDMLAKSTTNDEAYLDVADYVNSELIRVEFISAEKGKGVLANKDIKKGSLLVVSKAFSFSYEDQEKIKQSNRIVLSINLVKRSMDVQSQVNNLNDLVHRIQSNPFLAKDFYELYGGGSFDRNEKLAEGIVDIARLEAICCLNSFSAENIFNELSQSDSSDGPSSNLSKSTGVWIYPSYFNHSCLSNTDRFYFGDVVVIVASRDIKKDEEITLVYESSSRYKFKFIYFFI